MIWIRKQGIPMKAGKLHFEVFHFSEQLGFIDIRFQGQYLEGGKKRQQQKLERREAEDPLKENQSRDGIGQNYK